jgi:hypothetical protein
MEILAVLALILVINVVIYRAREVENRKIAEQERIDEEELARRREEQKRISSRARAMRRARSEQLRSWIKLAIDEWSTEGIELINAHRHALAIEKKRLTKVNPYGVVDEEDWQDDGVPAFVESVLMPSLEERLKARYRVDSIDKIEFWRISESLDVISTRGLEGNNEGEVLSLPLDLEQSLCEWCQNHVNAAIRDLASDFNVESLSGVDYEDYCREVLVKHGWNVEKTQSTGDQGVDLLATHGNIRACIQCKRFSTPVGNSAVQEVTAGKIYWYGTHAIVVTNAGFTKSAQALARSTDVLLLSHDELADLKNRL